MLVRLSALDNEEISAAVENITDSAIALLKATIIVPVEEPKLR
jgi:hypothetical protein